MPKRKQYMESPNAAADYFSNSVYDSQTTEDGQVVIKAPFQTMRIILYADTLSDTLWRGGSPALPRL